MTDELTRLAQEAVEAKAREEEMLARMTPSERKAYIRDWAERVAKVEVAEGCAYDDWANGYDSSGEKGNAD